VLALGGVYAGWSTSSPKAAADAPATPPSSLGPAHEAGSTRSRSPGTAAPKGSTEKGTTDQGTTDQGITGKGTTGTEATESGDPPAPPPTSPPRRAGPVRFGQVTTSGLSSVTDIADDRRVLSATFSDFEVTMDATSAEPVVTKTFSMTLPLTDGAKEETLRVHASGFASLEEGARARIALKGGGRQLLKGFATGSEEYVETLELRARPGVTYQLSFAIEINRGAGTAANGFLNMLSIEMEIS
jgi:hypothetical protein